MQTLFTIIVSYCLTSVVSETTFDPFEGPKPIAVFVQSDPWKDVIGSDNPRLAVYENGELIFAKRINGRLVYHHVTLKQDEFRTVRERWRPVLELKQLKNRYNIRPNATDQPEAMFYFREGDREVAISVYGLMAAGTELPAYTEFPGGPNPTVPPKELLNFHKWLCEIDYPNSKEWIPKYVEVMLWDYSYAPEKSIKWPKDWPSLNSDSTEKRGESYSIFLDASLFSKLRKFLATQKEKGAVEIEGKKMAVSYRFTFPGEPAWRKAFAVTAEKEEKQGNKDGK